MSEGLDLDPSTDFGARVARRLREEVVIWLTTVGRDGTPQPNPVWFLWDGKTLLTYNRADAARVSHVRERPHVSLNFDGNGKGGDIVVMTGTAEIPDGWPADQDPDYGAKYAGRISSSFGTPAQFASMYPVPIWIRPQRLRGH